MCVLLVAGCLHTPKPVSDHSKRVTLHGFSLLPPNEEGWYEMNKQESSITFGKKCKTGEFKTFASASLLDFNTQVKSEREFLDTVKSLREIYINP